LSDEPFTRERRGRDSRRFAYCTRPQHGGRAASSGAHPGDGGVDLELLELARDGGDDFAFLAAAVVSVVAERVFYRRLYRSSDLDQVLLTIGLAFVSVAAAAYVYGTVQQPVQMPSYLRGSVNFLGVSFAVYRLFLVVTALAITLLLVGALEYTRFGAQVRAAVDNQRMARGLGINVDGAFAFTFALGSGLAGLGGGLAIEIVGLDPSFAFTYLIYVLIVVSVGGLGSIGGSFAAATLIGISDVAGKYYLPELGAFLIYLVMIVLLMWRPAGLFGRR